jgi:integrase
LSLIISSLQKDELALATERKYMGALREFCHYVLAKPHVPGGNGRSLADKYGPIVMPFTKYDLPIHAADRPRRKRYALAPPLRDDLLEFLRLDYLPNQPLPHMAARNYLAILLQTEIGARVGELLTIRSQGDGCDIDWVRNRVRLFGKGSPYSGKRLRWVPLTPLATEVLRTFEKIFKPMFPKTPQHEYLFLNQDGTRLTESWYWKSFRKIVELARDAGVKVPADLKTHDLRRTYATNKLEKEPLAYRKLLKHLGHTYPSSVAPYLISTDEDVEEQQGDLIDIFVDPHIENGVKK